MKYIDIELTPKQRKQVKALFDKSKEITKDHYQYLTVGQLRTDKEIAGRNSAKNFQIARFGIMPMNKKIQKECIKNFVEL